MENLDDRFPELFCYFQETRHCRRGPFLEDMASWLRWVPGKWFHEVKKVIAHGTNGPTEIHYPWSKPASTTGTLFHTSKGLMATPRATLVMTRCFSPGKRNHGFRKAIICGHTRQYRRLGGWARLIAAN
jgi:hypothetical protein